MITIQKKTAAIIIGVALILVFAAGITIALLVKGRWADKTELRTINEQNKVREEKYQDAIATADSFHTLHANQVIINERQAAYLDSAVTSLRRFKDGLILIRSHETDSIVGSFDVSFHRDLFSEWVEEIRKKNQIAIPDSIN